ncbi:putative pinoresinol-lariciresinol reductase 3 [Colletotrichum tropicale]|nr:putative pinoresinol-lariciresinol reductase 3 [Colletotrichum tropicale]
MKVAIVGATGETGGSIARGLLGCCETRYEIIALVRPTSVNSERAIALQAKGVTILPMDLNGPEAEIRKILDGVDVVVSAIHISHFMDQIPLMNAAEAAGVGRFVPCHWATVMPPRGTHVLRDTKEDVLCHMKKIGLPYTIIDIGWWYQLSLPKLPSGRIDYWHSGVPDVFVARGDVLSALTDLDDVRMFTARIISDPRTINKAVFAFSELWSQESIYAMMERISAEKIPRNTVTSQAVLEAVAKLEKLSPAFDDPQFFELVQYQYWHSWGVRGDNQPHYAKYLGYELASDLYADLKPRKLEEFALEVLQGKGRRFYEQVRF